MFQSLCYASPSDIDEQTQKLITSGVAQRVIQSVRRIPGYENLALDECKFWVFVQRADGYYREPELQVIIKYPKNSWTSGLRHIGYGVTVETEGSPWLLADNETLSEEQFNVVRSLTSDWPPK